MSVSKKIQLRRCGFCQKTGHNKSTCVSSRQRGQQFDDALDAEDTTSVPASHKQTVRPPLNFFVHHVQYQNHESRHVINLKDHQSSLHQDIEAVGPQQNTDPYFFHQKINTTTVPIIHPQPATSHLLIPDEETAAPSPMTAPKKHPGSAFIPRLVLSKKQKENIQSTIKIPSLPLEKKSHIKHRLSEKLAQVKQAPLRIGKKVVHTMRATATPRHLAKAALVLLFFLFVPSSARTYYFDLKSTTNKIADSSSAGFVALHDSTTALMNGNLAEAQLSLTNALQNFNQATTILDTKYNVLQKIIAAVPVVNNEIQSRQKLITAGQEISLGNTYLLKGLSEAHETPQTTLTKNLAVVGNHLNSALPHYRTAITDLNNVDADVLPFEYQDTFKEFRVLFNIYIKDLENISQLNSAVQEIFGGKGLRRYLLIFQNPAI